MKPKSQSTAKANASANANAKANGVNSGRSAGAKGPLIPSVTSGASFLVQIHHAEHHSWQGSIQWLDTGEVIHFRSALELTLLMEQAVQVQNQAQSQAQAGRVGEQRREWQEPMRAAR